MNEEKTIEEKYNQAIELLRNARVVLYAYSHNSVLSKSIKEFLDEYAKEPSTSYYDSENIHS